jgi:hypothetical protein
MAKKQSANPIPVKREEPKMENPEDSLEKENSDSKIEQTPFAFTSPTSRGKKRGRKQLSRGTKPTFDLFLPDPAPTCEFDFGMGGEEDLEDDLAYFSVCAMNLQIEDLAQPERDTTFTVQQEPR